jgi:hypothetical protein
MGVSPSEPCWKLRLRSQGSWTSGRLRRCLLLMSIRLKSAEIVTEPRTALVRESADQRTLRAKIMQKRLEYLVTDAGERCDILCCLVDQAQEPVPAGAVVLSDTLIAAIDESLARGWIYSDSLQDLISAMDCRLAEFSISEFAQVFDFEEIQVWANSTKTIPTIINSAVAVRNAAFLLIQLKAMGFRIDDTLLSSRLRPLLAKKRFLVGREFYVFWQGELEAKRDAFILYCGPTSSKSTVETVTLPLGHKMQIISEGSRPIGVEVTPPGS